MSFPLKVLINIISEKLSFGFLFKYIGESEGTLFIKPWNDLEAVVILSAKFGSMFVKYIQNLLMISNR